MIHLVLQHIGLSVDPERWKPVFGHSAPKVRGGCKLGSWLDFHTNCTYPEAVALAESGDPETACCIGDFRVPGLKQGAWETMYFPANLGINMLVRHGLVPLIRPSVGNTTGAPHLTVCDLLQYTTALLETEPTMKLRLMRDLDDWMTLGKTHLQGSFAAFYLAAHTRAQQHEQQPQRTRDTAKSAKSPGLLDIANGTVQALLVDMAAMGPEWKWAHAVNRSFDSRTFPHREGVCSKKPCQTVAEFAMLPSLRPGAEYFWQRSPTVLVGGANEAAHELPPIDGLLAYWVGKFGGAF
jgi:hypothetical protein